MFNPHASAALNAMAQRYGGNFQELSRTDQLGAIAALMQVVYQCEFSEDWSVADELNQPCYSEMPAHLKSMLCVFDEEDQSEAIGFCGAVLLKLAMQQLVSR